MASSPTFTTGCSRITSSSDDEVSLSFSSCVVSNFSNRKPFRSRITITLTLTSPSSHGSSTKSGIDPSWIGKLHHDPPSTSDPSTKRSDRSSVSAKSHGRSPTLMSRFRRKWSLWRKIFFSSKRVRSIILLNVITLVYASDVPVLKEVEAIVDPAAFTAARFAVSAIPFIPYVLQAREDPETRKAGMELGVWVSLGYLTQALGLLTSDAGRASFISVFTVFVVPLLDSIFGAAVPPVTWFGGLMSILGVAMLESGGSPPSIGDLLSFLSAIFFGIHMLRTERISRNTDRDNFLPLLGYEGCVVASFSLFWYLIDGSLCGTMSWDPQFWTWAAMWDSFVSFPWLPAVYTGVFSTGLCSWVEMAAMKDVSAAETAVIYGLEPIWGAGFAWFILGERWGAAGWIGAAFVLGGSLLVQMWGYPAPSKAGEAQAAEKGDYQQTANTRTGLSPSPVIVHSHKPPSILRK